MKTAAGLFVLLALPALLGLDLLRATNERIELGNQKLQAGEAEAALELYDEALERDGISDAQARAAAEFNRGTALSALGKHDEAAQAYLEATKSRDTALRARAFYNLGNTFFQGEKYGEAVEAFKRSLMMDPRNGNAKWNLELALRRKRDQEQKQQDQKQQDQKQDQQQQDQKQQDQNQQDQDSKQNPSDPQPRDDGEPKPNEGDDQNQASPSEKPEGNDETPRPQEDPGASRQPPENEQRPEARENEDPSGPESREAEGQEGQEGHEDKEGQEGQRPPAGAPDMKEINAILDSLEQNPHEIEQQRARLRALRRRPPPKDW